MLHIEAKKVHPLVLKMKEEFFGKGEFDKVSQRWKETSEGMELEFDNSDIMENAIYALESWMDTYNEDEAVKYYTRHNGKTIYFVY